MYSIDFCPDPDYNIVLLTREGNRLGSRLGVGETLRILCPWG